MADETGTSGARATTSRRPSSRDFEVFLNFGGSKIRDTVVDFIYDALVFGEGVRVFYVDGSIRQEEVIEGKMMEVITNSKIYIPIFSKDYASSRWCLNELKLIMECWEASQKHGKKKTILPIFYDTDVSIDVKLKSEVYTAALQKYKDDLGEEVVKPWEIALQKATEIKGWDLDSHGLAGLTRLLVEKVRCELQTRSDPEKVPNDYVEMDDPMEGIMTTLECPSRHFEVESSSAEAITSGRQVFINYRGPDSRHTIVDALYHALAQAGIQVVIDDEAIRKGEDIKGELKEAIINAKIYILIFSKSYASSRWCLRELELIMECWEASQEQEEKKTILPIFYDVDVSDVKLRSIVYTTALQKHKDELGEDVVKPWEIALLNAAKLKGLNVLDHGIFHLQKPVVEEFCRKLQTKSDLEKSSDYYVGIDDPMKDLVMLLDLDADDVRFITFHGICGGGKTTLARLHGLVKLVVQEVRHKLWTTSDPEKFLQGDSPLEEYDKISREVMDTTEQLPQTVNVIAPSFRDEYAWGGTHKKLKKAVHNDELESSSAEAATSGRPSRWVDHCDVFISFRGLDSRYTIIDDLYYVLTRAGIRVFIDDEAIRKGETIKGECKEAIVNSKIYIPIFSKNYAASRWCLRELELIMECWEASQEQEEKKTILPIFYDVDASPDVRLRSEVYTTALQWHKAELGKDVVKPWETALLKASKIKGWNIRDHGLARLTELIKEEVCRKLLERSDQDMVPNEYVGMDDPVKDIIKLIDLDSHDVRFVAIHGIGGIGKTTIARLIFRIISSKFQLCAFLSNLRGKSCTADGIVNLQKELISQLLEENPPNFSYTDQGVNAIKKEVNDKRVLIVLDDLDQSDQLSKLAADPSWFGMRSRIIITTRYIGIMPRSEGFYQYKMQEVKFDDALKLFSRQVFNSDSPPKEYYDISRKVVDATKGHPLVITTIAPLFRNIIIDVREDARKKKDDEEVTEKLIIDVREDAQKKKDDEEVTKKLIINAWEGALKKLVHKEVRETLMMSYKQLHENEREIFLDIACVFIDKEIEDATYYWETRQLYPKSGIMTLKKMSFIEIVDGYQLQMSDERRDLGRNLVLEETNILERRSRLWSPEEALSVVCSEKGTEEVLALKLGRPDADCYFNYKQFAGLTNLMFLELNGGNFKKEDFKKVFSKLRWLSWDKCPDKFEATNLCFENLIVLMLSENLIADNWGGWHEIKAAKNLKVLKCTNCHHLTKSPNFSSFLRLERLVIKFCGVLRVIDWSIGNLKYLTYLEFTSLFGIERLPDSIGHLRSLSVLKLKHVNLLKLPYSIGGLHNLEYLCLWCPKLKELPESVGNLKLLAHLDISYAAITKLPESVSNLKSLKVFKCDDCPLKVVPDNIKRLIPSHQLDPPIPEGTEILKDK